MQLTELDIVYVQRAMQHLCTIMQRTVSMLATFILPLS